MNGGEFRARLSNRAAAAGISLSTAEFAQLESYFELLRHWNRRINLTALALEPLTDASLDRLLIEPLAASKYVSDSPFVWFDLGSGGGSPAVPLKIMRPAAHLTMVESRARKAAFLRDVVRHLGLATTLVLEARVEGLTTSSNADVVTLRALRLDQRLLEAAGRLLIPGARLIVFGERAITTPPPALFAHVERLPLLPESGSNLTVFSRGGSSDPP